MIDHSKLPVSPELRELMVELNTLTLPDPKRNENQAAARRSYLISTISVLKSPVGNPTITKEARSAKETRKLIVDAYRRFAADGVDRRTLVAGVGVVTHTTLASGGAFVPVNYFNGEFQHAVATYDPLFDENVVTYMETPNGASLALPLSNDTDTNAVVITENTKDSDTIPGAINQKVVNVFAYRTPKIVTSVEFEQDAVADYNVGLLERFFAERIARGVGVDLISGNGNGKPLGLTPSLEAVGVSAIVAVGSNGNDGIGSNDGTNSIGSDDLSKLYTSVQARYRKSPKCAWLMNDNTFQFIAGLKNKFGGLVYEFDDENPMLYGKPIYISPSMDNIGAGKVPVVFGDLSRWMTRYVSDSSYVRNYREFPGAVEYGLTAWSAFARYGGQLLMSNATRPAINYIINHT